MPRPTITTDESGQTMTEYSVVVGILVLGVIGTIGLYGSAIARGISAVVDMIGGLG